HRGHEAVVVPYRHFVFEFGVGGTPYLKAAQIELVADVDIGVVEPEICAEASDGFQRGDPDEGSAVDGEGFSGGDAGVWARIGAMAIEEVLARRNDEATGFNSRRDQRDFTLIFELFAPAQHGFEKTGVDFRVLVQEKHPCVAPAPGDFHSVVEGS